MFRNSDLGTRDLILNIIPIDLETLLQVCCICLLNLSSSSINSPKNLTQCAIFKTWSSTSMLASGKEL